MMRVQTLARLTLGAALITEAAMALRRFEQRRRTFAAAARRAAEVGRPLIVVGDPDAGAHTRLIRAYDCGDLCIDLRGCPKCQVMQAVDLTAGPVPGIADDSAVVFVSCVLEYVSDPEAALRELHRMAGSTANLFLVFVESWTLTAALYPGARWTAVRGADAVVLTPVSQQQKIVSASALAALLVASLWPTTSGQGSP